MHELNQLEKKYQKALVVQIRNPTQQKNRHSRKDGTHKMHIPKEAKIESMMRFF